MRSAVLILATLIGLGGALFVYFQFQPEPRGPRVKKDRSIGAATRSVTGGSGALMGAGSDVWVRYDKKTGELASQFRAAWADPQPDGTVLVERPQAEFVLDAGRVLRIAGARGSVIMPPPEVDSGDIMNARVQQQTPNRGHLYDVVLSLHPSMAEIDSGRAILTVEMNNVAFDNDTFRISTEGYTDASGNHVPADEVPVKVRGDDYDFDGRGLTIRWDQVGRKLQLLEIAHGESLTVKNTEAMLLSDDGTSEGGEGKSRKGRRSRESATASATSPATASTTGEADEPRYRASFEKAIRILRGGEQVVAGDTMLVDFLLEKRNEDDEEPAEPATSPATAPTTRRARPQGEEPATRPAFEGPLVIEWRGKLRVTPLEDSAAVAGLEPGGARVEITGSPVQLAHDGASAECGTLAYHSADARVSLDASADVPRVTMSHPDGWNIVTRQLDFDEQSESVVLRGESRAVIPDSDPAGEGAELVASWNDIGTLRLVKDAAGNTTIEHADLHGDVSVTHPRVDMSGGRLQLAFEPAPITPVTTNVTTDLTTAPATAPSPASTRPTMQPRRLLAAGGVKATLKEPGQPPQSIAAETLEMETATTPDGRIYPRMIKADGQVVASSAGDSIETDHLLTALAPATQPANEPGDDDVRVELESLVAESNVKLTGSKGASGAADRLVIENRDGVRVAELTGQPARLSDGDSAIAGPVIRMMPDTGRGEIVGPGTLHTEHAQDDAPAAPIDLSWAGGVTLDSEAELVRFNEQIVILTTDADGTRTKAEAAELRLTLADAPATQPATQATTDATQPATARSDDARSGLGLAGGNFMEGKVPKTAALAGGVRIESVLAGADGQILRRLFLEAPEARYDLENEKFDVPTAGRILFEDHRPPAADEKAADNDTRGATAFQWKKSLDYDGKARLATMQGGVQIHHDPDGAAEPFTIYTERVRAELEPHDQPDAEPAGAEPAMPQDDVRVRAIVADGGVRVETAQLQFSATELSFDPASGIVTARGTKREPITVTDADGGSQGSVQELRWNIRTDEISMTKFGGSIR